MAFKVKMKPKDIQPELFESGDSENEDDLNPKKYSEAVTWATDWTTETIILQLQKRTISLNPSFQRRDAWTKSKKSQFIESLILGLPIPQIVLAERKNRKGSYIVLDGKQRLLSLAQFAGATSGEEFTLNGLKILQRLNGADYDKLKSSSQFSEEIEAFHGQTIRTVVVKNWPNEDFLYTVFLRLNTNSVPLSPQELRKALHPGPFLDFVDEAASESSILLQALGLTKPDFRMRDVEIVIRYFGFRNFSAEYSGNLKLFLDDTCKNLNAEWDSRTEAIWKQFQEMEMAIQATKSVFGEYAFKKYTGEAYETRLNRAVFDLFLFYLSEAQTAEKAVAQAKKVKEAFERLCEMDHEFRSALETSTKTTSVVHKRFTTWGRELKNITRSPVRKYEGPA